MENRQDNSQLLCIFKETLFFIKTLLIEFESIFSNKKIIDKIPTIKAVYMEAIIVNLGKILNATKNDKFGVVQLKSIAKKKDKEEIENVIIKHKNIIDKINNNRNKRFSHTDRKHHELCFSESEISMMKKNMIENYGEEKKKVDQIFSKIARATNKKEERYTIGDLKEDLPEINDLLNKLNQISLNVLVSYYKK